MLDFFGEQETVDRPLLKIGVPDHHCVASGWHALRYSEGRAIARLTRPHALRSTSSSFSTVGICICLPAKDLEIRKPGVALQALCRGRFRLTGSAHLLHRRRHGHADTLKHPAGRVLQFAA